MASSVPFHYVELRTFAYATEDEARVERALRTFLPPETPIDRQESEGHTGDRIVVLVVRLERADEIRTVLDRVAELEDYAAFVDELEERVDDDCSLYVQFDKQAAYRGRIAPGAGIMLRAKVEAYPARRETAIENAREALSQLA